MQREPNNSSEQTILSAWQEQVTSTTRDPHLRQQLLFQERDLLPRFAAQYKTLKALPRQPRRHLQRQWKRSLAGVALLLVLGANPALAATINVAGTCTLVRAIVAANNDTTATGHCTKGSGADRIVLPSNSTQTLTAANTVLYGFGPTGLPIIRSAITIEGNGSTIQRASSAPKFRIFAVAENGDITLRRTKVSGGVAATVPTDPAATSFGGGIFNDCGAVSLVDRPSQGTGRMGRAAAWTMPVTSNVMAAFSP